MKKKTLSPIVHFTGTAAFEKSMLLVAFQAEHPNVLQRVQPSRTGELFDRHIVDFHQHAVVTIENLAQWDRGTLAEGIKTLEREAKAVGKHLMLVSPREADLKLLAISLEETPTTLGLTSTHTVELRYRKETGIFRMRQIEKEECLA